MMLHRYGVKIGRLWIRWPYFEWRDLWIGFFVKERYWEMGRQHQVVYVCIVPTVVFLFDWTLPAEQSQGKP